MTGLQSRINAFEAMSGPSSAAGRPSFRSAQNPLDAPISPSSSSLSPVMVTTPLKHRARSPSPSPPNLGRKSSLIDFHEHETSPPRARPMLAPSISFQSPPRAGSQAPALPPRKTSYSSLQLASSSSLPPPVRRSDSLTIEYSYPPRNSPGDARKSGHAPVSSISSFHSISLSSDGGTGDQDDGCISTFPMDMDVTGSSLGESFDNISTTSVGSPTSMMSNWEKAIPPKLPQRPQANAPPPTTRRAAPPPPPSPSRFNRASVQSNSTVTTASDRSSMLSTTSRTSVSTYASLVPTAKHLRPTPVPAAARTRYENVFTGNVMQRRKIRPASLQVKKSRQAAGWRGLSVDLIGETPSLEHEEGVDANERLDGAVVRLIWEKSRLEKGKLKEIWNECDTAGQGSLDRHEFVKGMWLIDEELRRAQLRLTRKESSTSSHYSFRVRSPPAGRNGRPPPPSSAKPVLLL